MQRIIGYFLEGLLILSPVAVTAYLIYTLVKWADSWVNEIFEVTIPGIGLVTILVGVTVLGFISNSFLVSPLLNLAEKIVLRTPFVKIIYTSIKDLMKAFVGDEKKFDRPVIVQLDNSPAERLGFLTDESVEEFDLPNHVSVYVPFSYNFYGMLYIVPKDRVRELKNVSATDTMKYIVSGGVTHVHKK